MPEAAEPCPPNKLTERELSLGLMLGESCPDFAPSKVAPTKVPAELNERNVLSSRLGGSNVPAATFIRANPSPVIAENTLGAGFSRPLVTEEYMPEA